MMRRNKQQWRALIAAQQSSGLSAAAYCRQHSINPKYFSARKTQLQNGDNGDSFVLVKPAVDSVSTGAEQRSKASVKQPRIRMIDIELGDAPDTRSLSMILNQVLL